MTPHTITPSEWLEVRDTRTITEQWGLTGEESAEELSEFIYGVRFDYQTDGPGYCGDLFILKGGGGVETPPVILYRGADRRLLPADED